MSRMQVPLKRDQYTHSRHTVCIDKHCTSDPSREYYAPGASFSNQRSCAGSVDAEGSSGVTMEPLAKLFKSDPTSWNEANGILA